MGRGVSDMLGIGKETIKAPHSWELGYPAHPARKPKLESDWPDRVT